MDESPRTKSRTPALTDEPWSDIARKNDTTHAPSTSSVQRAWSALFVVVLLSGTAVAQASVIQPSAGSRIERLNASASRPTGNLYRAYGPAFSGNGQLVAFWSDAADLVAADTNRASDVFVYDRLSGSTERVSVAADSSQANGPSLNATLSEDGRFVAFESRANNLVPGDTNSSWDVFVKDRLTGEIQRISVSSSGVQGNGPSNRPILSADARFVAFSSEASTFVADDTNSSYENGGFDIFVKDRLTGEIERVSVTVDGEEAIADCLTPSISADGRFVAFGSYAPNLVQADNNSAPDIFVKDRATGVIEIVSLAGDGSQSNGDSFWNPSLSTDGRFVAFWSEATNLVPGDTNGATDIFVKDRQSGLIERVNVVADGTQANGPSYNPALSADGRYVAFWSEAINLVGDDNNGAPDIFVKDRQGGAIERVSVAANGTQANGPSYNPTLSSDGQYVLYWSEASNLVPDDTNGRADVFVVDRIVSTAP